MQGEEGRFSKAAAQSQVDLHAPRKDQDTRSVRVAPPVCEQKPSQAQALALIDSVVDARRGLRLPAKSYSVIRLTLSSCSFFAACAASAVMVGLFFLNVERNVLRTAICCFRRGGLAAVEVEEDATVEWADGKAKEGVGQRYF